MGAMIHLGDPLMSDTVWAAIIAVVGAISGTLLGATLSQFFSFLNRRAEAVRQRDQYLLDIEVKKIQDVLLALHNATNMISRSTRNLQPTRKTQ
jgi:ABC-type lipoprotein release transport system permease subunit